MSADMEETLAGNDELRALVAAVRAAPLAHVSGGFADRVMSNVRSRPRTVRWHAMLRGLARPSALFPLAACLVALLATAAIFMRPAPNTLAGLVACQRADGSFSTSTAAPYVQAFAVTVLAKDPSADRDALAHAVDALVRTQDAEGGWKGSRLSALNVVALETAVKAGVASASSAYRRGMRYMRTHGIRTLTTADMANDARIAAASRPSDKGLSRCIALAARL